MAYRITVIALSRLKSFPARGQQHRLIGRECLRRIGTNAEAGQRQAARLRDRRGDRDIRFRLGILRRRLAFTGELIRGFTRRVRRQRLR